MIRAMMIATVVAAGAWAVGNEATAVKQSCCFATADCCANGGSDCCLELSFVSATAEDEKPKVEVKEVKLTGTLVCGSCKLNESKKCANVLQVKEKDKVINYWLIDKGSDEAFHDKICGGGELKDVTVTGAVTEKDGKKSIKSSKVDVKK